MIKSWERNGTRRPFPAMYEAQKMFGEKVWFRCPDYVEPKHCKLLHYCAKIDLEDENG